MESTEVVRALEKASGALAGLHHVTTYKGKRENKQGQTRAIAIEVHFDSLGNYNVEVSDEDGREAWGGRARDLDGAVASVGWGDLDADRYPPEQRASPGSQ